jgi:hypothetical protein
MLAERRFSDDDIYGAYSKHPLSAVVAGPQRGAYRRSLAGTAAAAAAAGVVSYPQREDGRQDRVSTEQALLGQSGFYRPEDLDDDFFRAKSTGAIRDDGTAARLSLRLVPTTATAVWNFISTRLIGRLGVTSGKVAGAEAINNRSDSVVLYLNTADRANAQAIAALLASNFPPAYFEDGVPVAMTPLARGIGFAERHPDHSSHGSAVSAVIELALENLQAHLHARGNAAAAGAAAAAAAPVDPQQLLHDHFLPAAMREFGIDPNQADSMLKKKG